MEQKSHMSAGDGAHSDAKCWLFCRGVSSCRSRGPSSPCGATPPNERHQLVNFPSSHMEPYLEMLPMLSARSAQSATLTEEKMWAEMDMDHQLSGREIIGKRAGQGAECVKSGLHTR